jgi:hypothetical protein
VNNRSPVPTRSSAFLTSYESVRVLHINTEDVQVTRQVVEAGKLLDIELLDHLIIAAGGRHVSLKERGLGFE